MRGGSGATIYDLARATGVSASTVSRALNGSGQISADTVRRIREAAGAMGYRPNHLARSLTVRRSDSIGLMLPDIANPFFPALVREIQLLAHQHGRTLLLCNTGGSPEAELEYLEILAERRIEGVLTMGLGISNDLVRQYLQGGMRFVALDRPSTAPEILSVQADHRQGGLLATSHLTSIGHRRIGYVSGPLTLSVAQERLEGHHEALRQSGLTADPRAEVVGDFSEASGYGGAKKLLGRAPGLTALAVANDLMALGVIAALREQGLEVPADVSVVGFDDIELGRYAVPALTTVRQPLAALAKAAIQLLIGAEPADGSVPGPRLMPVEMVVRGSTGPPPRPDSRSTNHAPSQVSPPNTRQIKQREDT